MLKKRVIAVILDCDGQVVQSVRFRHTNVVHYDTRHAVEAFASWSVDEIVLLNVSKSPGSREKFVGTLKEVSKHCFLPLAVGGWIADRSYADELLRNGADKLVVNTLLADAPDLFASMAKQYGRQCMVASVDIGRQESYALAVWVDRGRRPVPVDPADWARRAQQLGAGEILFNSIEHDGARRGYDLENLGRICQAVDIPVIGFGGVFSWQHLHEGIDVGCAAVAAANQFHYQESATRRAKSYLAEQGVAVRREGRSLFGAATSPSIKPGA
jgi:cyclase